MRENIEYWHSASTFSTAARTLDSMPRVLASNRGLSSALACAEPATNNIPNMSRFIAFLL